MASGVGDDGAVGTQQEQLHTPQPSPLTSGAFLHFAFFLFEDPGPNSWGTSVTPEAAVPIRFPSF